MNQNQNLPQCCLLGSIVRPYQSGRCCGLFGDSMKAKLTDGRVVELQPEDFNPVGQIYVSKLVERGIADDTSEMCELLGAAPCDMRYGMVHPGVDLIE